MSKPTCQRLSRDLGSPATFESKGPSCGDEACRSWARDAWRALRALVVDREDLAVAFAFVSRLADNPDWDVASYATPPPRRVTAWVEGPDDVLWMRPSRAVIVTLVEDGGIQQEIRVNLSESGTIRDAIRVIESMPAGGVARSPRPSNARGHLKWPVRTLYWERLELEKGWARPKISAHWNRLVRSWPDDPTGPRSSDWASAAWLEWKRAGEPPDMIETAMVGYHLDRLAAIRAAGLRPTA